MDSIEGAVTQLDSRLLGLRQDLSRVGDKLQALQDEVPGAHQAEAEVRDDLRSLQFTLARMKQYISEVSVSYFMFISASLHFTDTGSQKHYFITILGTHNRHFSSL